MKEKEGMIGQKLLFFIKAVLEGLSSHFTEDTCASMTSTVDELLDGGDIAVEKGTFITFDKNKDQTGEGK